MEEETDILFAAAEGWGEVPFSSAPAATNTEEQTGEGESFGVLSRGDLFGSGSTSFDGMDRGGDLSFAGISREPKFGVVSLRLSEIGRTFCGGCIGTKGRRMCIRGVEECDVSAHAKKAYGLFEEVEEVVFIRAQSSKDAEGAGSVHSSPTIARRAFEEEAWVSTWSLAEKTLKAWQVSFASLSAQESILESKASIEVCDLTSKQVSFAITPSKKKRRASLAAALGESPGDFEVDLNPMLDELGPSADTAMAALMGPAWGAVTQNIQTVARVARAAHKRIKAQAEDVEHEVEQIDLKLSGFHALLGNRSEELGTQDVFSLLGGILEDLEGLRRSEETSRAHLESLLASVYKPMVDASIAEQVTSQISSYLGKRSPDQFRSEFSNPLSLLLRRCSPNVLSPGGLWAKQLQDLEARAKSLAQDLSRVEQRQSGPTVTSTRDVPSGGGWGADAMDIDGPSSSHHNAAAVPALEERVETLSKVLVAVQRAVTQLQQHGYQGPGHSAPTGSSLGASPPPSTYTRMAELGGTGVALLPGQQQQLQTNRRFEALEKEVAELRGQLRMSGVTVGGFTFDSPSDVRAWLALHGLQGKAYLFVDPLSLLSISDTMAADEKDATQERLNTERIKDGCTEATRYRASFLIEIPPILGKKGDPSTSPNERQLAAIPKYEDWNTGMGRDGVVDRLTDILSEGEMSLSYQINAHLNGPALQLATKMLTLSVSFWEKLGSWMTKYFGEIKARSQSRPQESRILDTHCVRRILSEARKVRAPGKTGQDHDMVWGALQAHALFRSILDHKIQGHPKISVILQQHLVDHATPMSSFLGLEAAVKELQRQVGQQSKAQDRSVSFANKQAAASKAPKGGN